MLYILVIFSEMTMRKSGNYANIQGPGAWTELGPSADGFSLDCDSTAQS